MCWTFLEAQSSQEGVPGVLGTMTLQRSCFRIKKLRNPSLTSHLGEHLKVQSHKHVCLCLFSNVYPLGIANWKWKSAYKEDAVTDNFGKLNLVIQWHTDEAILQALSSY